MYVCARCTHVPTHAFSCVCVLYIYIVHVQMRYVCVWRVCDAVTPKSTENWAKSAKLAHFLGGFPPGPKVHSPNRKRDFSEGKSQIFRSGPCGGSSAPAKGVGGGFLEPPRRAKLHRFRKKSVIQRHLETFRDVFKL